MPVDRSHRSLSRASRLFATLGLSLIAAFSAREATAQSEIRLSDRFYFLGCNGTPTGGTEAEPDVREGELVNWVLNWTADGDDYERVRVVLEPEDVFTAANVTIGNGSTNPTSEGVVGNLADTTDGSSRHYWTWSGNRCTNVNKYRFRATVYYTDTDGNPDVPYIYDSGDTADLEFDDCPNSVAPSAHMFPPEVCTLQVSNPGSGVLFKWSHMDFTDVYNMYRGTIPFEEDDTHTDNGGPRVAYTHTAFPNSIEVQGFCTQAGTLTPGLITCTCTDCHSENSFRHREYSDASEPSPTCSGCTGYHYLLSGEDNCLVAGQGVEGTVGFDSFGDERPYGGGICPPMS